MKYVSTAICIIITISLSAQKLSYCSLSNHWTQGKVTDKGKIVKADINRGGWMSLDINKDSTVAFTLPFNCGFGLPVREGKWKVNKKDATVIFSFTKSIEAADRSKVTVIDQVETYKIKKLTKTEMILSREEDGKTLSLPFVKQMVK